MKYILDIKNLFLMIFIVMIYLLFVALFYDVLKDREFSFAVREILIITGLMLIVIWSVRKFFTQYPKELSNSNIIWVLFTSFTFSLIIQSFIAVKHESSNLDNDTNPLYEDFQRIASEYNLDLSYTKKVWTYSDRYNYSSNAIFQEKPHSIDILFIGDSSIAWGMIPGVIEQMTGKKVAMYAYESTFLNEKSSPLFNALISYYLKEDGIVIYAFDNWTKLKKPHDMDPRFTKYEDVLSWDIEALKKFATQYEKSFFDRYLSFSSYQSNYEQVSESLKVDYKLYLRSIPFFEKYLEPLLNKEWSIKKSASRQATKSALCWDDVSITLYSDEYTPKSIHSDVPWDTKLDFEWARENALVASKMYGKKIYMVPLYANHKGYKDSRTIYHKYYKDLGFELCDLGRDHPKDEKYMMQSGPHMANTGGLMQSILIGKWLQEYLQVNP